MRLFWLREPKKSRQEDFYALQMGQHAPVALKCSSPVWQAGCRLRLTLQPAHLRTDTGILDVLLRYQHNLCPMG